MLLGRYKFNESRTFYSYKRKGLTASHIKRYFFAGESMNPCDLVASGFIGKENNLRIHGKRNQLLNHFFNCHDNQFLSIREVRPSLYIYYITTG
jgi:hypothetical protein